MKKNVLITGITGMDGSLLADYLIPQGYHVYGLVRRSSSRDDWRIKHLYNHPQFHLIDGDVSSQDAVFRAIQESEPEMIFNLAAQSFVPYSWSAPAETFLINSQGALNLLEGIRVINPKIRFYQASSSEMFGKVQETPQRESTVFYPRSPYGVSKVAAHYTTINYRESFGLHASSGILFNHEGERRGLQFVTRKITNGLAQYFKNGGQPILLGNLDAKRDWGYAADYVKAMVKMVQHPTADSFVIATGKTRTIREFCETAALAAQQHLKMDTQPLIWKGEAEEEVGYLNNKPVFAVSKNFYRPAEVDLLLGDATRAKEVLGWEPETSFEEMVRRMFVHDYEGCV